MIDPRPGDSLLFLGAEDLQLAGECGAAAGLNGRTVVVDASANAAAKIEAAGGKWGALLEHVSAAPSSVPLESTFDVTVAPDISSWTADVCAARVREALRLTRPGGRIVLIAKKPAGFFAGRSATTALGQDAVLAILVNAGAVASRRIASVKSADYYEARKPRSS